jgi:two-component system nitrogen regulation response regulator GlnG
MELFERDRAEMQIQLSESALEELRGREWHGNVRELRNAIEHALIAARGSRIMPDHFPPPVPASIVSPEDQETEGDIANLLAQWTAAKLQDPHTATKLYEQLLALVEPPVLRAIVQKQGGQVAAAARVLGLHRTTLRKKLDQYGLQDES